MRTRSCLVALSRRIVQNHPQHPTGSLTLFVASYVKTTFLTLSLMACLNSSDESQRFGRESGSNGLTMLGACLVLRFVMISFRVSASWSRKVADFKNDQSISSWICKPVWEHSSFCNSESLLSVNACACLSAIWLQDRLVVFLIVKKKNEKLSLTGG